MSLTSEAIQTLVKNGNVPLFLKQLETATTQSQVIALPTDFKLTDLEQFQEFRNNLRGKFNTNVIDEFIKYVKDHVETGSKVFVNGESMQAEAIFDIGDKEKPGHQRHKAALTLNKTAPYQALLRINGKAREQRDTAEWLEDYSDFLQAFSSTGEAIPMDKAVAAVRDLNFEVTRGSERQVHDFAQAQSEYERMATKTKDDLVLPAVFVFKCEPYLGLSERTFELRMSIVRNDTLTLRIKRFEEIEEAMSFEFLEILEQKQKDSEVNIPNYIGEF